jgi:hypothetical protein
MSLDTRTERRQARHRRNLVIGGVVALASVLSVALLVALLTGGDEQPTSADRPVQRSTSAWAPTGDDVWSEAASPTSAPTASTSTAPGLTTETGTPAATSTTPAPRRTAVTVSRTSSAQQPAGPATPTPTATTSSTTNVPPGQLKRPKPKTTPPPRR